ncbi:Na(+)/H(+) exchanger beta-like isoform X2 [Schistocerca serialis cubense]|uniref:Na(+)/H(+) exchanger beta-like isoform X2 n=1 Tax=Schistocerca serialis cubense TaxID=2023355 RepID=UPI00214F299D|nr:Na(+)/H(+) exchanger beta-like isoform X2 [Schistocerca serialis cubense]
MMGKFTYVLVVLVSLQSSVQGRAYYEKESYGAASNHVENLTEGNFSYVALEEVNAHHGVHVASWRWDELGLFFTFTIFIVVTGLAKVGFHHAQWLSSRVPESCLMIVVGVTVGAIIYSTGVRIPENVEDRVVLQSDVSQLALPTFTPRLFFLILLPPVILESAYSLYDRAFFDNFGTVMLYAVVGTLFNTFTIGPILFGLSKAGAMGDIYILQGNALELHDLSLIECLVFSALISGVDPVAVLAIFQEIGVNKDLYFLVFGESLFNDAVTVVLYNTMVTFCEMPVVPPEQFALAALAFFTVSLGGATVGIIFGLITALLTRSTTDVRVVEPLAVLGVAYLSYITAELVHFSGIISITFCGLVQAHYALKNISRKSYTTVKYFTRMLSSTSDAVIFLFLGMVLVSDRHIWHTGFVMWTLVLCLVCRFLGVFLLTATANPLRVNKINAHEQFIMGYGGLRGAVAFSLAEMLDKNVIAPRQVFVTTTLVVILFTVFIQGSTIKPLVKLLHIKLSKMGQSSLNEELNNTVITNLMAGIEEITGVRGDFYIRKKFDTIDDMYLKRIFLHSGAEHDFTRLYEKLTLAEHYAHLYGPVTIVESKKAEMMNGDAMFIAPAIARAVHLSSLFPGVELRHSLNSDHQPPASPDSTTSSDAVTLRRALRSNPYQKFHERFNRNLINDDCQELEEQLMRRHLVARTITQMAAAANRRSALSDPSSSPQLGDEPRFPRRRIQSQLEGYFPEELEGIDAIFERTGRRLSRQFSVRSADEPHSPTAASPLLRGNNLTGIRERDDASDKSDRDSHVTESSL